jgi:hypothetical protein
MVTVSGSSGIVHRVNPAGALAEERQIVGMPGPQCKRPIAFSVQDQPSRTGANELHDKNSRPGA